jgi:hypothetical protein
VLGFEQKITVAVLGEEGREAREGEPLRSAQRQPDRAGAWLEDEVDADEALAAVLGAPTRPERIRGIAAAVLGGEQPLGQPDAPRGAARISSGLAQNDRDVSALGRVDDVPTRSAAYPGRS